MSIFDQASKKVSETVKGLQKKTNDSMAIKRIETQIKEAEDEIQGVFAAIGQVAYAAHAEGKPFTDAEELFAGVTALKERVAQHHKELDKLNDVKRCPGCNAQVQRLAKFCPQCGAKLELETEAEEAPAEEPAEIEICPNCGAERADNVRFCEGCGHEFTMPADGDEKHEETT